MSAGDDRVAVPRTNPFFGSLAGDDLEQLAPLLREVAVGPGEFLLREGERAAEVLSATPTR